MFCNYKSSPTDVNRDYFFAQRKMYISYKRQVKFKFHANEKKKLSDLYKNNPRGFWNYINNLKKKQEKH